MLSFVTSWTVLLVENGVFLRRVGSSKGLTKGYMRKSGYELLVGNFV